MMRVLIVILCLLIVVPDCVAEPDTGKDLLEAIKSNDPSRVKILLDLGSPDPRDWTKGTALGAAVSVGNSEIVVLLLKHGANVDASDMLGRTALFRAVGRGNLEILKLLVDAGAKPDHRDLTGATALDLMICMRGPNRGLTREEVEVKGIRPPLSMDFIYGKVSSSCLRYSVE